MPQVECHYVNQDLETPRCHIYRHPIGALLAHCKRCEVHCISQKDETSSKSHEKKRLIFSDTLYQTTIIPHPLMLHTM